MQTNEQLIQELKGQRVLKTPRMEEALRTVERANFVPLTKE